MGRNDYLRGHYRFAAARCRAVARLALLVLRSIDVKFALCYQTVVCLSVCPVLSVSVTLVYCGQTVGWIRMPLGMGVGSPGHIVLHGDTGLLTETGTATAPHFSTHFVHLARLPISATGELLLLYSSARAEPAPTDPCLVTCFREVPFGGHDETAPHLGGQIPKNPISGCNRRFQA